MIRRKTIHKEWKSGSGDAEKTKPEMMLEIAGVTKKYSKGQETFTALDSVSMAVNKGDFIAVIGPSGSGKSTLLNAAGGLIHPDDGKVLYEGHDIYASGERWLASYRKRNIGFVFQQFHLVPYLTVHENILVACRERKHSENAAELIEKCSLAEHSNKYPSSLSVGEKQRTAFIRAIVSGPELLLADEPTGNLDPGNSKILLDLISEYKSNGGTVILVSHDSRVSDYATRTVRLERGKIS